MIAKLAYITIDTVDPEALAPFWAQLLGVDIAGRVEDGQYVVLAATGDGVPAVAFQRVPEPKSAKARTHLDLDGNRTSANVTLDAYDADPTALRFSSCTAS